MKKIYLLLLFNSALCIFNCAFSQNPLVKMWDYRYGGTLSDELSCFLQTSDGGFILGGTTLSDSSGNKTQPKWGAYDYWIVKTDSLGIVLWDRDFGGTNNDFLSELVQTSDGGFLLGGYSNSGISGNKTQPTIGLYDYWIVKIDSVGNFVWDKDLGGNSDDFLISLDCTNDGGYILGGASLSDSSGDKTQPAWGIQDYWIIKIDSLGNKLWDKNFGGIDDEKFCSIRQTSDSGFIVGGYTTSDISGDKTQPTWGTWDYWVIKTDASGIKQWDLDFGGADWDYLSLIDQTTDGGYILSGWSTSGISGNKTQSSWGYADYWLIKVNSSGIIQWDKSFGGADYEEFYLTVSTPDGGYLISGDSYSPISGDKTENNLGTEQSWFVKTDSTGSLQWDKTVFTTGHDESGRVIMTRDGCYALANYSNGGIGGYKSQPAWSGAGDYWIVKFCDTTTVSPTALFTSPHNICPGTCIDFINLSVNATIYQWTFPGASPNTSSDINPSGICYPTPGNYDVQLIATNAIGSDTLILPNYITVYAFPLPQSIMQSGDTLFAIAGSASYQWYFNGNIINGATDYFYVAPSGGDYNVVATDANGCEVEAAVFDVVAGMQLTVDHGLLTIFPNPVEDKVKIQIPIAIGIEVKSETAVEISIYNVLGEKIFLAVDSRLLTVDCRPLLPGLYYVEITAGEKTFRSKFIKQ